MRYSATDSALYGRMGQDMLKGSAVCQVGLRDVLVVRVRSCKLAAVLTTIFVKKVLLSFDLRSLNDCKSDE